VEGAAKLIERLWPYAMQVFDLFFTEPGYLVEAKAARRCQRSPRGLRQSRREVALALIEGWVGA
jgi:hypothetical protein